MNLDDFSITCFCLIDEMLPAVTQGRRLRHRGPQPNLADSEVITMELVGMYLGLAQDQEIFDYFRRHYAHFFPQMAQVARTTVVRQVANLWVVKERLWCGLRDELISYDGALSLVESVPLPVCRFARAPWGVRFRGIASFAKEHADRQTFYGFRLHVQLSWPGLITRVFLAPAHEADGPALCPLCQQKSLDALKQVRRGHSPLLGTPIGKPRLRQAAVARFVCRSQENHTLERLLSQACFSGAGPAFSRPRQVARARAGGYAAKPALVT